MFTLFAPLPPRRQHCAFYPTITKLATNTFSIQSRSKMCNFKIIVGCWQCRVLLGLQLTRALTCKFFWKISTVLSCTYPQRRAGRWLQKTAISSWLTTNFDSYQRRLQSDEETIKTVTLHARRCQSYVKGDSLPLLIWTNRRSTRTDFQPIKQNQVRCNSRTWPYLIGS